MPRCPRSWRTMRLPRQSQQAQANSGDVTRSCIFSSASCNVWFVTVPDSERVMMLEPWTREQECLHLVSCNLHCCCMCTFGSMQPPLSPVESCMHSQGIL